MIDEITINIKHIYDGINFIIIFLFIMLTLLII
jgi:hypothetical protein